MCRRARCCSGTLKTASTQPSAALARGRSNIRRSPSARIWLPARREPVTGRTASRRGSSRPRRFSREIADRTAGWSTPSSAISRDQRGDAEPAACLPGVQAIGRNDQRPRLGGEHLAAWRWRRRHPSEPSAASAQAHVRRFIDYRHGNGILGTVSVALEEGPVMQLSPSAHADTFCRDNLPPADQWPDLDFSLAGLSYPDRLNAADELLNPTIEAGGGEPAVPAVTRRRPGATATWPPAPARWPGC